MCMSVQMSTGTRAIVCLGGPLKKIMAGSRIWHFEMHRILGPMPTHKKTGQGIEGTKQFWEAVTWWAQQGERVDAGSGMCLYERPVAPPIYRIGRGHYTEDAKMAATFGVTEPVQKKRRAKARTAAAVDPHAASTGTPTPRA